MVSVEGPVPHTSSFHIYAPRRRAHTCLPRELPLARGTVSHFPIVSKTCQLPSPVTKTVLGLKMKSGGSLLPTVVAYVARPGVPVWAATRAAAARSRREQAARGMGAECGGLENRFRSWAAGLARKL